GGFGGCSRRCTGGACRSCWTRRSAVRHVGIRARAGGFTDPEWLSDDASLIRDVGEARWWRRNGFRCERRGAGLRVDDPGFGIGTRAGPVRAAARVALIERTNDPVHIARGRRVVERAAERILVAAPLQTL